MPASTQNPWLLREVAPVDLESLRSLLLSQELPGEGLEDQPGVYVKALVEGKLAGAAGLEVHGDHGLLRSLVVAPALRGRGLGVLLLMDRLRRARSLGLASVHLLTTTASGFFERHGFSAVEREAVPEAVRNSREYGELCPDSATVMALSLRDPPASRTLKRRSSKRRKPVSLAVHQVDAFTAEPFGGNPAAVVPLETPRDADWMQRVAMEMNLSETAFPVRGKDGWDLRWFTPEVEVDLCGHATLATAHVLWETGAEPRGKGILFRTRSGVLEARPGDEGWIQLDFPAREARECDLPEGLSEAIGHRPVFTGHGFGNFLLELESEEAVRAAAPDFGALRRGGWAAIVTAPGSGEFDFVSRYFAPPYGIDEDPVTGSAHCALAPHWAGKLGRSELTGYQASRRGGVVRVRSEGDRVVLSGQAVTVLRGHLECG